MFNVIKLTPSVSRRPDRLLLWLSFFSVALSFAFFFSGCAKSPDKSSGEDEMVLRHVLYTKIAGLDPGNIRDRYSTIIASQMFETLYQYHFLKRPYEIVPLLAADLPQVSEDKRIYTITIKKGVRFADDKCFPEGKGRELKADDFVYSLKRVANIKYLSQNWALFDDKIVGLDEFREYTKTCKSEKDVDYSRSVEGLQATDDYTLVVKLKRPWPQMIGTAFADGVTSPMAKEAVDFYGKDIISNPVGTGPYKLKVWRRGSYIELERSPTFRGELYPSEGGPGDVEAGYLADAGKPIPFADKVVWMIIEEYQPAWFLFLQGKVDISVIPKDNYKEVIITGTELTDKMRQRNIHLKTFEDPSVFWIGFNMLDPVLGKNKPLRLAINRAIDREKFIELFFNGRHEVAHGIMPPMLYSYDPSIKEKGFASFNPAEARVLLKEAEKVHGGKIPVLKMAMPGTGTFSRQYGQFLTRYLNDVGIELEVEDMDWPTYMEKLNNRDAQMFASGVSMSIPDAEDLLGLFRTKDWAPGSNKFLYSNPEYDKLYEVVSVMDESEARRDLYRKMELIILEDCPAVFMNHRVAYALHHDWYLNYKPNVFLYGVSKYRRIDLAKRKAYKDLVKKLK